MALEVKAKCRRCEWTGAIPLTTRGITPCKGNPAITGIACPGCGRHALKRVRSERKGYNAAR